MRQLPRAGDTQDGELDQNPADDTGIGRLGLVPELGLSFLLYPCQRERTAYFHPAIH